MVLNWPSRREEDLASPLPAEFVSGVHTQSSLSEQEDSNKPKVQNLVFTNSLPDSHNKLPSIRYVYISHSRFPLIFITAL